MSDSALDSPEHTEGDLSLHSSDLIELGDSDVIGLVSAISIGIDPNESNQNVTETGLEHEFTEYIKEDLDGTKFPSIREIIDEYTSSTGTNTAFNDFVNSINDTSTSSGSSMLTKKYQYEAKLTKPSSAETESYKPPRSSQYKVDMPSTQSITEFVSETMFAELPSSREQNEFCSKLNMTSFDFGPAGIPGSKELSPQSSPLRQTTSDRDSSLASKARKWFRQPSK